VDKPIIFAFHGYPFLIHRLAYRRTNHDNMHVRGYKEEGTTTTPFDMVVMNDLDRFHLVNDAIDRIPKLRNVGAHVKQLLRFKLIEHRNYIVEHGEDMPEVRDWKWGYYSGSDAPKTVIEQPSDGTASAEVGDDSMSRSAY
jgi:xylulose-5-phosphate/fructose-6-phosphate phosphoketolase